MTANGRGASAVLVDDVTRPPADALPRGRSVTVLFAVVFYLVVLGRWGSHIGVPGMPIFIADVGVAAALVQTVVVLRWHGSGLRAIGAAARTVHLALLLTVALLGWAVVRGIAGIESFASDPLSALRDVAPYGYAVVGVAAFLLPVTGGRRIRLAVYAGLTVHLVWMVAAPWLPGWPRKWPELGDAAIFTPRPDFDAAVLGVAVALALYDLLGRERPASRWRTAALAVFAAANAAVLATSPTRAGLLSALVAIGTVLVVNALRSRRRADREPWGRRRAGAATVLIAAAATAVIVLTPAGQRLGESFGGGESSALGTLQAREYTWSGVSRYIFADAVRTATGVGFGPDFITDSGTSFALEGTEYKDVRSPHNYLLGTFARLGVAGGLLAAALVMSAAGLAVSTLRRTIDTIAALAALLVLALPITALLGVVLESPFGAIPYFWAIGHLARVRWDQRTLAAD